MAFRGGAISFRTISAGIDDDGAAAQEALAAMRALYAAMDSEQKLRRVRELSFPAQ